MYYLLLNMDYLYCVINQMSFALLEVFDEVTSTVLILSLTMIQIEYQIRI